MKRTKDIHYDNFRKSWRTYRLAPVALAISAVFMLSGCEQNSDETVSLFQNANECSQANPTMAEQCNASYDKALLEAERTAPKYASRADCVAEFGESQCVESTSAPVNTNASASEPRQSSLWMPLMAGYMFGRMTNGGYANSPLFTSKSAASPANGRFVDASGRSFGAATTGRSMNVDKGALAPKPTTTTTVTRGGFGQAVAKQSAASTSRASTSNSSRSSTPVRSGG